MGNKDVCKHRYVSTFEGWTCAKCGKPKVPFHSDSKRYFYKMFHEKTMFPMSGKDAYVVERVKLPTMRRGSQVIWQKYFKNEVDATRFLELKQKLRKL